MHKLPSFCLDVQMSPVNDIWELRLLKNAWISFLGHGGPEDLKPPPAEGTCSRFCFVNRLGWGYVAVAMSLSSNNVSHVLAPSRWCE